MKVPSRFTVAVLATVLFVVLPNLASAKKTELSIDGSGALFHGVKLRPGVKADIHVTVLGDIDSWNCQLTIHGGPYTAETWRPYAEALGPDACVLAIDLPGHGASSLPKNIVFGELLLDDYVTTVLTILDRLAKDLDIEPRTIVGHSLGGTVVQMAQQRLIDAGTSLEQRYGISEAILVASDYPREVPWEFVDSGAAGPLIGSFIINDPQLGNIMQISAETWPAFFFTNLAGEVVAGAPTPAEIIERGYVAPGEPEMVIAQLLGMPPFGVRPSVDAGIFASGTRLRTVAYENDGFILLSETEGLYTHLTGDESLSCFVGVLGPDKTHATQISNPSSLVAALAASENCG